MHFVVTLLLFTVLLTGCAVKPPVDTAPSNTATMSETDIEEWRAEDVPSYANYDGLRPGANIGSTETIALIELSLAANEDFVILLDHYKSRGYPYAPIPGSYRAFTNSKGVPFIGLSYNAWNENGVFSVLNSLYETTVTPGQGVLVPAYTYLIENDFTPRTPPVLKWVEDGSIRKMRRPIAEEVLNAQ